MSNTNTIRLVTRSGHIRFDMVDVNTSNTTITSFKEMIASTVGIPVENQCILRKDSNVNYKEMRDEQTIYDCGIIDGEHLFVWPSTDPVVMKLRAAAKTYHVEDREEINRRTREEERLTQIWLQEYKIEAIKSREGEVYWAEWRRKNNLFAPISRK